mmetsp:Transcript_29232/g.49849  ORF Transcript_29232/g.49849 Transcript_29232/m.49849 type:complete len:206 (+) Transcript_29232:59-676(+)
MTEGHTVMQRSLYVFCPAQASGQGRRGRIPQDTGRRAASVRQPRRTHEAGPTEPRTGCRCFLPSSARWDEQSPAEGPMAQGRCRAQVGGRAGGPRQVRARAPRPSAGGRAPGSAQLSPAAPVEAMVDVWTVCRPVFSRLVPSSVTVAGMRWPSRMISRSTRCPMLAPRMRLRHTSSPSIRVPSHVRMMSSFCSPALYAGDPSSTL